MPPLARYPVHVRLVGRFQWGLAVQRLERAYETYRPDTGYGADLASAYDARGQFRIALNDLDNAIEDFEKGIAIDPTNTTLIAHYTAALS